MSSTNTTYVDVENALSICQKLMTFVSSGDNYGGGNIILENISAPENTNINLAQNMGNVTVVNSSGALAIMDSGFVSEKGFLLSGCKAGSMIALKNVALSTDEEIKDFVESFFVDTSCLPYFLAVENTKINADKFWSFNKAASKENPNVTGKITNADAADFSAILAYDYPLSITDVTAGYARFDSSSNGDEFSLEGVSFVDLYGNSINLTAVRSEIKTVDLHAVDGAIKSNLIGDLILSGLSDDLKVSNNKLYALTCNSLSNTSDVSYYDAINNSVQNVLEKKGIGGNWWDGFSNVISKCVNEDDDAFCDSKYSFSCNGKTYEDLYPLTLFTSASNDEQDKKSNNSSGNGSGDGAGSEGSCTKNSDCLALESCVNGKCTALKCATSQVIVDHACVDCVTDSNCSATEKCVSGKCIPLTCKSDEKAENHKCVLKTGSGNLGGDNKSEVNVDTDVNKGINADVNDNVSSKSKDFLAWVNNNKMIIGIVGGIIVLLIIILITVIYFAKHKKDSAGEPEEPTPSTPKEEPIEAPKSEPQESSDGFDESSWSK